MMNNLDVDELDDEVVRLKIEKYPEAERKTI